jgi:methylmalonyl-CoA mutase
MENTPDTTRVDAARVDDSRVDAAALDRSAPDEPEELALAGEFPAASRDEWVALVDRLLQRAGRLDGSAASGAGVDALTWSTPDGIAVAPLYSADDVAGLPADGVPGRAPFVRGGRAVPQRPPGDVPDGWDVRQRHADPDPAAAREAVLDDLANGATSIWLAIGDGGTAVADLPAVLDGVHLDLAPVVLDAAGAADPDDAGRAAEAFLAVGARVDPARLRGTLGLDPIGRRARTGDGPAPDTVAAAALRVARAFPLVRAVVVDGLPVHVAGGSDAQELGYALACGVAYLRALTAEGLDVDTAAGLLEMRLAATAAQFPTIAKLRAARRLWARALEVSGAAPDTAPVQHAVASPTMYTRRDPYGNLLRGTLAAFAAGVGGADAVTVAPFDAGLGTPTAFSRRIARNTQSVLVMEAHLARVIDPAGGSWFVASLTDALARAGWAFFQELEAAGGVVAALDAGLVADGVAGVRAARERAAATGRAPVTGVSEFPDLHEKPVPRTGPDLVTSMGHGRGGLPVYRPADPFEDLRDRSDGVLHAAGSRPRAFLATLGPLAAHATRTGFARGLLHAGGIDTVDAGPTEAVDEVTAAFAAAGTPVAVLCSTDAIYAERAAATVAALRAAGARHVLLAGTAHVDGLDGHLRAGGDALAALAGVWAALDVGARTPEVVR